MKQINKDKIVAFVNLDKDRYINKKDLKYVWIFCFLFISAIILIFAILVKKYLFCVLTLIWNLAYLVFYSIAKKIKETYCSRFCVNGILSIFMSTLFLLLGSTVLFCTGKNDGTAQTFLVYIVSYLVLALLNCIFIDFCVKKGTFINQKRKKGKRAMIVAVLIFPILESIGVTVTQIFISALKSENSLTLYVFLSICEFIAIMSSLACYINLIKYYYCKKYSIYCDQDKWSLFCDVITKQLKKTPRNILRGVFLSINFLYK